MKAGRQQSGSAADCGFVLPRHRNGMHLKQKAVVQHGTAAGSRRGLLESLQQAAVAAGRLYGVTLLQHFYWGSSSHLDFPLQNLLAQLFVQGCSAILADIVQAALGFEGHQALLDHQLDKEGEFVIWSCPLVW